MDRRDPNVFVRVIGLLLLLGAPLITAGATPPWQAWIPDGLEARFRGDASFMGEPEGQWQVASMPRDAVLRVDELHVDVVESGWSKLDAAYGDSTWNSTELHA